jgi:predicted metal-binding protein
MKRIWRFVISENASDRVCYSSCSDDISCNVASHRDDHAKYLFSDLRIGISDATDWLFIAGGDASGSQTSVFISGRERRH